VTYNCGNDSHTDEAHDSVKSPPPFRFEVDFLFVPFDLGIAGTVFVQSRCKIVFALCSRQRLFGLISVTRAAWRKWK